MIRGTGTPDTVRILGSIFESKARGYLLVSSARLASAFGSRGSKACKDTGPGALELRI